MVISLFVDQSREQVPVREGRDGRVCSSPGIGGGGEQLSLLGAWGELIAVPGYGACAKADRTVAKEASKEVNACQKNLEFPPSLSDVSSAARIACARKVTLLTLRFDCELP